MSASDTALRQVVEHFAFETSFDARQIVAPGASRYLREIRCAALLCAKVMTGLPACRLASAFGMSVDFARRQVRLAHDLQRRDPEFRRDVRLCLATVTGNDWWEDAA